MLPSLGIQEVFDEMKEDFRVCKGLSSSAMKVDFSAAAMALLTLLDLPGFAQPIKVDPDNHHYFNYQGKPTILLTSDHTYFAVAASDFDYAKFLDKLAEHGMNFTRLYPGAHPVNFDNQPHILPWAKDPSGKYNLDAWNHAYFERLHGFIQHAQAKGIIVDVVLFNGFGTDANQTYQWRWVKSPLNRTNNIQCVGAKRDYFCTLEEPALVNYEKAYVRKIVSELNRYENVIYDTADEPDFFNAIDDAKVNPWVDAMMNEIINQEASMRNKHLVAETFHPTLEDHGKHWGADSRTTWISVEYNTGLDHFNSQYANDKPYVLIETISPVRNELGYWKWGYGPVASRVHSWAFILAGGAGFMEFNDDFDSQAPGGRAETTTILQQRKKLRDFIEGFDFARMSRFTGFSRIDQNAHKDGRAWGTAIAEQGKQYALYASHTHLGTHPDGPSYYCERPGSNRYQDAITFNELPANRYQAEWIDPSSGSVIGATNFTLNTTGNYTLSTPQYKVDIALRMKSGTTPTAGK